MKSANQSLTNVSFHEATLVDLSSWGDAVRLTLEGVLVSEIRRSAIVIIEGVQRILRDGMPIKDIRMEEEDGEILSLLEEGDRVVLVVEWNDFATKRQRTVVYNLLGGKIALARFSDNRF